jgi:hypothetical protein
MVKMKTLSKPKREFHYFRVIITYSDGETSANRIFKDQAKAEVFAARQMKSQVVKKTKIEPFIRDRQGWLARQQKLKDKATPSK